MTFLKTPTSTTGDPTRAATFLTKGMARKFADRSPYRTRIVAAGRTTSRASLYVVAVESGNFAGMSDAQATDPETGYRFAY